MEINSYRALIFPPIVLSILVGLFYSFGVFEVLLDRNESTRRETVTIRPNAPPGIGVCPRPENLSPKCRP
jgi:hypothetical protein